MARRIAVVFGFLAGCTVITSPGDYEGGDAGVSPAPCERDEDCAGGVCETLRGECVECLAATDCAPGRACVNEKCVAEPVDCGGVPCPESEPFCVTDGTSSRCVACLLPADCGDGQTCSADFECVRCMPASPCEAGEVCVTDPGGDRCLGCDLDDDGEIARDPRCASVPGDRDCDDDGDGFCHSDTECAGVCEELAGDCNDGDGDVRPVLIGCAAGGAITACAMPGDSLPGAGGSSATVLRLGDLSAPIAATRAPNGVVVDASSPFGTFDVLFLAEPNGGAYDGRHRWIVDAGRERRATEEPLPDTAMDTFSDLRAASDPATGVSVATLGDRGGDRLVILDNIGTRDAPSDERTSALAAGAEPPLAVGVEILAAAEVPYVAFPELSAATDAYTMRYAYVGGTFMRSDAFPGPATPVVTTARGLVVDGRRDGSTLTYWSPRVVMTGGETKDAGSTARLVAATEMLGFDLRVVDGAATLRTIAFLVGGGFSPSAGVIVAGIDGEARFGLTAIDGSVYVAYDVAEPIRGGRAIEIVRGSIGAGTIDLEVPFQVLGPDAGTPSFATVFGVEVAVRDTADGVEVAVLVHGQLTTEASPGLYLAVIRRCR